MVRTKDIQIINNLTKYAKKNKNSNGYTMVACLVKGKTIVSIGINDYIKTHSKTPQNTNYIIPTHAEVKCLAKYIIKNKRIASDLMLYVIGLTKSDEMNYVISSKPCASCLEFIKSVGINKVIYLENIDNNLEIKEMNPFR